MSRKLLLHAVSVLILFFALVAAIVPVLGGSENLPASRTESHEGVDLLHQYPTKLTVGDTAPERARSWDFTSADIFRVSHFSFEVGKDLRIQTGIADLGIGHCKDGAVWAVIIPRQSGELTSTVTNRQDAISSLWLRFHPGRINHLFPPDTVFADGATNLFLEMRRIAHHKITSSWQAGGKAMIPDPNEMTVDVDTKDGLRRFFDVDTQGQRTYYWPDFENHAVKPLPPVTPEAAQATFNQLWEAFDSKYAMFVLRPEVDWTRLREEYRPKALASKSTLEFADVCAEMLKSLRDLHVWLTVAGDDVPVFSRPRTANANPQADQAILGNLNNAGDEVAWAVTDDKIGYIVIYGWDAPDVPKQCQEALEKMRDTRGLIVDVRLNGGGSEDLAKEFASRFVNRKFVYAYSQYRSGPSHTNLTEKFPRIIEPEGPWRYDRPVIVLIGQKCMSSNESFIGMMTGDTNGITMGDHTCGSSGNPEMVDLPLEMTVSVPQWIDYLPDGKTPVNEHGFQPQIPFKPTPGAFEGNRDNLLTAALERLRQEPLPAEPIAGAVFVSDDLMHKMPEQAAFEKDLKYIGDARFGGAKCRFIEGWGWDSVAPSSMTPIGFLTEWWIDKQTSRPLANRVFSNNSMQKTRFFYDTVNQPLSPEDFAIPRIKGLSPVPVEPLGEGYTNRFINASDGSDGNMLIHYGKQGPKGWSGDGYGDFN